MSGTQQRLAEALRAATGSREDDEGVWSYPLTLLPDELADAVLPVVDAIAAERAAEALEGLAQRFRDLGQIGAYCVVRSRLDARAAALTADGKGQ